MASWSQIRKNMLRDKDFADTYKDMRVAMDIADALMTIRLYNGWTQKELAKRAKVSQADISRYENMEKLPRVSTLKRIAKAGGYIVRISLEQIDPDEVKQADGQCNGADEFGD